MGAVLSKIKPKRSYDQIASIYLIGHHASQFHELAQTLNCVVVRKQSQVPKPELCCPCKGRKCSYQKIQKYITVYSLLLKDQNVEIEFINSSYLAAQNIGKFIYSPPHVSKCIIFIIDFRYVATLDTHCEYMERISERIHMTVDTCYFYFNNSQQILDNITFDTAAYKTYITRTIECSFKFGTDAFHNCRRVFKIQNLKNECTVGKWLVRNLFYSGVIEPKSSRCSVCRSITRCKKCRCSKYYYCGRKCQKYHWSTDCKKKPWIKGHHRLECSYQYPM